MDNYFTLIILSVSIVNIGLVIIAIKQYLDYVREKKEYLFIQKIEEIKDKERKQLINYISSELHDNISQMISLSVMSLGTLKDANNVDDIGNIRKLLNKTLTDVRYLIKTIKLRESFDFDLDLQIQELIDFLNQSTDIVFLRSGKAPLLDNERKYLLLRIIQELLNNILKYSKAQKVKLIFENHSSTTFLRIVHNGESFQPSDKDFQKGYGLTNILENTKLLNGAVRFEYKDSNIIIELPETADFRKRGL